MRQSKFKIMKPKKYEKHNINNYRGIYFALGLTLVLAFTYIAFEWKSYESTADWDTSLKIEGDLIEEVPVTVQELKLPPPRMTTPPIIEIAPDDTDIIEVIIESTEPDANTAIVAIDSIDYSEPVIEEEIPFLRIEEVPLFPGCENEPDKKACFQQMIHEHIRKNFEYPDEAVQLGLQGKVFVMFIIGKDGDIDEIRMRSPHDILGNEARRIISKLPRMTPGKQRGQPVKVSFSLPVVFKLQ